MQKIAIVLVLAVLWSGSLFSQDRKMGAPLSEVRKNKNQLDLDIKNIFNGLGGATLIYKRVYQVGNLVDVNSIRLLRVSARIYNQINATDYTVLTLPPTTQIYIPADIIDMQLNIGFERQKATKNFVYYYGMDAFVNFVSTDEGYGSTYNISNVAVNYYRGLRKITRTTRTGFSPLFGVKYYFTNRLSLGIETGFNIFYFTQSTTELIPQIRVVNGQQELFYTTYGPIKSVGFQTYYSNLKFVTVGFTF